MKKILLGFLSALFAYFLCYLIGAFVYASFDIVDWSIKSRAFIGFIGSICAVGAFVFACAYISGEL